MKQTSKTGIKLKKGDFVLVAFIIAIIILLFIPSFNNEGNLTAVIYENGQVFKEIDLTRVDKNYKIICQGCEIFVEKGKIFFENSDCKDKLCVKRGALSKAGDTMACVPNKVVITLKNSKKQQFDAVAY